MQDIVNKFDMAEACLGARVHVCECVCVSLYQFLCFRRFMHACM